MHFEILTQITDVETIATGSGIREIARRLASGEIVRGELHWYEAAGIGKREFKVKELL